MNDVEWLNEHGDYNEWRVAARAKWMEDYGADDAYDRMIDDTMDFAQRDVDEREAMQDVKK